MSRRPPPRRVFEHQRIWRLTPEALQEAVTLLVGAIQREHAAIDHVIGVANGGTPPARLIAATLGLRARTIRARHNASNGIYQQATGTVQVDLDPLAQMLAGKRLRGRILVVDDICGSGSTLRAVRRDLATVTNPGAQVITATLCLNAGATSPPDYSIWTVADWVVFPWEQRPRDQDTEPLPTVTEVTRHA